MTNGRKSSNLVKSHELICHFITLYLVSLPPYKQPKLSFGCPLDAAGLSGIAFWKQKLVGSLISINKSLILQKLQNQLGMWKIDSFKNQEWKIGYKNENYSLKNVCKTC